MQYVRDPAEIYAQSFATIEHEVDLASYSLAMAKVVTRLIHACGMTDIVDDLDFAESAAEIGADALRQGAAIYCDVEMVRAGIIRSRLPEGTETICTLNDARTNALAVERSVTRSAAAVDLWKPLSGSICVIGNAPTALFRLLERIDEGVGTPALIVGIPVGFVGAVESKRALADHGSKLPFVTVHGRRGGSAMASSVINGLSGEAK